MNQSKISIIIPAHNVAAYVEATLESVLKQTVAPYEILVFNDGSTDATDTILQAYADHPLVRYFSQDNRGLGPTRNLGADRARGDYLYFLDADDLLDAGFVERMQQLIVKDDAPDLVLFSGTPFVQDGFSPPLRHDFQRRFRASNICGERALVELEANQCLYAQVSLYLVRRAYWYEQKLRYPYGHHQDEDVLVPLILGAECVTIIDQVFFYYRIRPDSVMTRAKNPGHVFGRKKNLLCALRQLQNIPKIDRKLRSLMRQRCLTMTRNYLQTTRHAGRKLDFLLLVRALWVVRRRSLRRLIISHIRQRNSSES